MKLKYSLILPLFLHLLPFIADANTVTSQDKLLLNLHRFQWNLKLHQHSPCSSLHQSRRNEYPTVLELEIKHRDFCSSKSSNMNKGLQERVTMDQTHVQFLQTRIKNLIKGEIETNSDTQMPLNSGTRLEILNYVVSLQLGGKNMTVIVDTGSDLTWVQCQPCRSCYSQQEPIFDPSNSISYGSISCNSSTCTSLQEATASYQSCLYAPSTCSYYVSYGDGSYTRGDLAIERLDLGKTRVDGFVFGCGRSNKGLFGEVSGLLGLGRGDVSLISQTYDLFGGVFSYCLPDTGESGSLILGRNVNSSVFDSRITYTKLLQNPQLSSFYMLNMTGMSVGGLSLNCSGFGQNGILIDSGTVITRLPPSIYSGLKNEFTKQFSGYPLAPGFSILDTCFNLSTYKEVNVPTVRMQFQGNAEVNVDVNGVVYFVKTDASQVCLAFASLMYEDEIAIIGNYQQKNLRVVYDTKQSLVGFAKEQCGFQ